VLPGDAQLGARLVSDPGVDKVSFTGSTKTGSEVTRLCAQPIKRLTLELGGKSPNLIFGDADLDDAIPSACWSIFFAAGQSCEARSRIMVQRSVYDEVLARLVEAAGKIVVGDPLDPASHVGSLISRAHRERVHGYVERAREHGASAVLGGVVPAGKGAFYPPTLITGAAPGSETEQEEVFGPVAIVVPFDTEDEAIELANATRYGLFASVWTLDGSRAHRLAHRIDAGMVGLNVPYTAFPGIGLGGFKQSGFGRELSLEALDAYTETKSVLVATGTRAANPFRL
jgi:aldehyde dehydrogenase (NAD+)